MKHTTIKKSDLGTDWTAEHHLRTLRTDHACQVHVGHGATCNDPADDRRDDLWQCPVHVTAFDWAMANQD